MPTLIVYATKYGCTEKCANMLAEKLKDEVTLCNLLEGKADPAAFDAVIVGGPYYMGRMHKKIRAFSRKHMKALKGKKTGLFVICMAQGEDLEREMDAAFPEELKAAAIVKENFGGEYLLSKMESFHRLVVTKITNSEEDQSNIHTDAIDRFAEAMNRA
jgi:menaquinone-dependent protoporphyrinogen oxidase